MSLFPLVGIYLLLHIPAFIAIIVGYSMRKKKPSASKIWMIAGGIYLLIGTGICGTLLGVI